MVVMLENILAQAKLTEACGGGGFMVVMLQSILPVLLQLPYSAHPFLGPCRVTVLRES